MSATGGAQAAAAAAESAPVEATSTRRGSGLGKEPTALSDFLARFDHKVIPYVLIAPFFVLFTVFGLYPLIYNGVVSFQNWEYADNKGWMGFANYTRVFGDACFWHALGNTFGIFLLSTVPQLLLALILASLLNRRLSNDARMRASNNCGTVESRKIPKVLPRACQKQASPKTRV